MEGLSFIIWTIGTLVFGFLVGFLIRHLIIRFRGGILTIDREGPPLPQDAQTAPGGPAVPATPDRTPQGHTGTNRGQSDPTR